MCLRYLGGDEGESNVMGVIKVLLAMTELLGAKAREESKVMNPARMPNMQSICVRRIFFKI